MNFIDHVTVTFESGRGGGGSATFHREKHVPRGGPNGADGGKGGAIILIADRHKSTLFDMQLAERVAANNGTDAHANKRGKDAEDIEVRLPVGTIVSNTETGEMIVDLDHDGMRFVICKGGKGGLGNVHFTNSVRQAPTFAQKGGPAEVSSVTLELKLLADVALIGLPNAGKSTLLGQMSSARPKIADYPFTTLSPNLGVVTVGDSSFVMADLPGLIEGASEGIGLGHDFLKHARRNRVLLHIVDAFPIDESIPMDNYRLIEEELKNYDQELYDLPRVIAVNKADLSYDPAHLKDLEQTFQAEGHPVFVISGVAGIGTEELKWELLRQVQAQAEKQEAAKLIPVMRAVEPDLWEVEPTIDGFHIKGKRVERMIAMTDMDNSEAIMYLHRRLQRIGVIQRLRELGIEEGATVTVGDFAFTYKD